MEITRLDYAGDSYIQERLPKRPADAPKKVLTDEEKTATYNMKKGAMVQHLTLEGLYTEGMSDADLFVATCVSDYYTKKYKGIIYKKLEAVQQITDLEDVLQDVFEFLLKKADTLDLTYFPANIYGIVQNSIIKTAKDFKRFKVAANTRNEDNKGLPTSDHLYHANLGGINQFESAMFFQGFLATLKTSIHRDVFILRYLKDWKLKDIDTFLIDHGVTAKNASKTALDLIKRNLIKYWDLCNPADMEQPATLAPVEPVNPTMIADREFDIVPPIADIHKQGRQLDTMLGQYDNRLDMLIDTILDPAHVNENDMTMYCHKNGYAVPAC
jgi:DNA-directed RNA polymerase specialized sigma24 family protein